MLTSRKEERCSFECEWSKYDFEIIKEVGRGKMGEVSLAREKKSDYIVALKKMCRQEIQENQFQKQIKRQIIIQSLLRHDNILKLFGYFWDEDHIYLVLQYAAGGELYHFQKTRTRLTEQNISVILRQLCHGLEYMHSKSIIHRDIKPENLLVSFGQIKIADFGWSIHSHRKRETLCGTLDYLSPEMVKGQTHDSTVDIWSLGILAYELAVGKPPFESETYESTYQKIMFQEVSFPNYISYELRMFIRKALQKVPTKRVSLTQLLNDSFITMYRKHKLDLE